MPDIGHNSKVSAEDKPNVGGIAAERLLSIVERFERIEDEVKALRSDQKDLMQEARSAGFDPAILRQVIRLRAMDSDKRDERDHLLELYRRAVGV